MIFDWSGQFPITQNMGLSEFSSQDDFSYECVSLLFARWNRGVDIYCERKTNFRITKRLCVPNNHSQHQ